MKIVAGNTQAREAAKKPNQPHIQQINLKGVLSGNPSTSQYDGEFYFPFMMQHALIGLQVQIMSIYLYIYNMYIPIFLSIYRNRFSSTVLTYLLIYSIWRLLNETQQ